MVIDPDARVMAKYTRPEEAVDTFPNKHACLHDPVTLLPAYTSNKVVNEWTELTTVQKMVIAFLRMEDGVLIMQKRSLLSCLRKLHRTRFAPHQPRFTACTLHACVSSPTLLARYR